MSGHQTWVIYCDGAGCAEKFSAINGGLPPRNLRDLRPLAAAAGWTSYVDTKAVAVRGGPAPVRDFCPGCSAKRKGN